MWNTDGMLTVGIRGIRSYCAYSSSTSSSCPSSFGAVTRADLRKYGATIGCAACSDIAVLGKTAKPHTEECRTRIGEQMEHDVEGHERLQVHKRRRDAEPEVEWDQARVVRENEGDPALNEQQDVEMPVEVSGESVSVLLTSKNVLACDSELKASEARNTTCKMSWKPRRRGSEAPKHATSHRSGGRGR